MVMHLRKVPPSRRAHLNVHQVKTPAFSRKTCESKHVKQSRIVVAVVGSGCCSVTVCVCVCVSSEVMDEVRTCQASGEQCHCLVISCCLYARCLTNNKSWSPFSSVWPFSSWTFLAVREREPTVFMLSCYVCWQCGTTRICPPLLQQSINISCQHGLQQQTLDRRPRDA